MTNEIKKTSVFLTNINGKRKLAMTQVTQSKSAEDLLNKLATKSANFLINRFHNSFSETNNE